MENVLELLKIVGISIYLSLLLYGVFIIVLTVIHIVSKLFNRFKGGKIVYSSIYGEGEIINISKDGTILVNFTNHIQAYDSKGRAVVQTMFRRGLKATIRDNIKVIK